MEFLRTLFDRFSLSQQRREFTTVKAMTLPEFKTMLSYLGICDENLMMERDALVAFNLSMMTQVDELSSDRHL
jgi:hypothetical protein